MYARSTTIQAQPQSIDAGIAHMRDSVMPALEGMPGCVGLSLLVDRTSGRCIATSSWDSEEAMRASAESIEPIRDQAAQLFGGSAQVEEWEIAAMHREHRAGAGACVRATWVKVDPDQIDGGIDFYKTTLLPALEELEGSAVAACSSTERPVVAWPPRPSTTPKRSSGTRTSWTGSGPRAARKQTQRCSTSATSSWRSHTCVCPRWPDRRTSAARLQMARPPKHPGMLAGLQLSRS